MFQTWKKPKEEAKDSEALGGSMDYKFCCFGTYDNRNIGCIVRCPYKKRCETETKNRRKMKMLDMTVKYVREKNGKK